MTRWRADDIKQVVSRGTSKLRRTRNNEGALGRTNYNDVLTFIPFKFIHFIHQWLYSSLLGPCQFFTFPILYTVGRTPCTGNQPVERPLPTHRTTQTWNKRTQTSVPWLGFEPTIPVLERTKTVHALDRAANMIGALQITHKEMETNMTKRSAHLQSQRNLILDVLKN
jgi:hypothetical protein